MNETEIEILQKIIQDQQLFAVLKKFFFKEVDKKLPQSNPNVSNEIVGQQYRAYIEAQDLLEKCFITLESHNRQKTPEVVFNRAR